jgi:hypothetical protein
MPWRKPGDSSKDMHIVVLHLPIMYKQVWRSINTHKEDSKYSRNIITLSSIIFLSSSGFCQSPRQMWYNITKAWFYTIILLHSKIIFTHGTFYGIQFEISFSLFSCSTSTDEREDPEKCPSSFDSEADCTLRTSNWCWSFCSRFRLKRNFCKRK